MKIYMIPKVRVKKLYISILYVNHEFLNMIVSKNALSLKHLKRILSMSKA